MISCARRYSKPGVDKRADMLYNNTIICRRGIPCSAKQHSLSPCSLPPRKFIPKQRAQNCFAPTSKTDGKTPSVFLSARPRPACAALIYLLVTSTRRRARVSRATISKLSLRIERGEWCRFAPHGLRGGDPVYWRYTVSRRDVPRGAKVCRYTRSSINFCYYAKAQGYVRRDV